MENIIVNTGVIQYPIIFSSDFSHVSQEFKAKGLNGRKICIITDTNVEKFYLEEIKANLSGVSMEIFTYIFNAGEKNKTLETINNFYQFFLENHFDRKTVLVALGGGVCGDMVGFAAATYLRGISFVQIPTTLLAQVDSSVGGKTGVDFKGSKNIIGAFYQPELVYINVKTLNTLSKREFFAGMAEVIKYGYIMSKSFYSFIIKNKRSIMDMDTEILKEIIKKCCLFKSEIVSKDEKETGIREILNFGHTIGHAIETSKNFELLHGECVALGIVALLFVGVKRGELPKEDYMQGIDLLKYFNLPVDVFGLSKEEVYEQMFLDKKVKNNKMTFVLLCEIGKAYLSDNIDKDEVMDAISSVIKQ